ncbi:MAG: gamma carbonic anhydrase family protein [Acidimicrobiia bacterium]
MLIEHRARRPRVHETAYVAPTATLCGEVSIGEHSRVLFGAVLTAEGGPVEVGSHCIIMENAVIRGTPRHPARLGDHVLVGPRAHLTGCVVEDKVFLATGCAVFNGARIGERPEVRVNGTVHLLTNLLPATTVPIGWIAVGDPAQVLAPDQHDRIWEIQEPLDFPKEVFGLDRPPPGRSIMPQLAERYARALSRHFDDTRIDAD